MQTWMERACRKSSVLRAVFFGSFTVIAAVGLGALLTNTVDDFSGPHEMDDAALLAVKSASRAPHHYVRVACRDVVDTGVAFVKGSDRTPYWAVRVGGKALLVKSSTRPTDFVDGVVADLKYDLSSKFSEGERAILLPIVVEEESARALACIGLLIVAGLTAVPGWFLFQALRWARDPRGHPALARFAADGGIEETSARIESELASPETLRIRGRALTPGFYVDERLLHFDARSWRDLVWAYKKRTKHSVNLIPTGSTYEAMFFFADGKRIEIKPRFGRGSDSGEAPVDRMIEAAAQRAPWAEIGYGDAVHGAWRRDRGRFVHEVAVRRDAPTGPRPTA
jgi:hypothetical protein